jgi:hypothetical protein
VRGSLPLISQILDQGTTSGYLSASGELPLPEAAPPPPRGKPRRTKVKLTPPVCHEENTEDDVRVYMAPPDTGLGTFDLGSVPASVTPPRSWRRAAWFATASSGGVVVALLFAGSALVGKPAPDQAGGGWIPGLGGGLPTIEGERIVPGPAGHPSSPAHPSGSVRTGPLTSTDPSRSPAGVRSSRDTTIEDTPGMTVGPTDSPRRPTPTPTTPPIPAKPQPTPAPYDADPFRFSWQQGDPATLAQNSQRFLDAVTENPQAAHDMTTGQLQQEGAKGLEQKYADVAYIQVEHVQVHQYDGKTVCTVKTVRKNGQETTDQHTLTFQNGKIASDGS